jgi:hypothetical protein
MIVTDQATSHINYYASIIKLAIDDDVRISNLLLKTYNAMGKKNLLLLSKDRRE